MVSFLGEGLAVFGLGYTELVVILLIVLLIFGAARLPEIGRALGQSLKELRRGFKEEEKEKKEEKPKEESSKE